MSETSETASDASTSKDVTLQMEMRGGPEKVNGSIFLHLPSSDDDDEDDFDSFDSDRPIPVDMKKYLIHMHDESIEGIRPQDRWNMDEILFRRKKTSSSINCFETMSADGKVISPMVVFETETVDNEWIAAN